MKKLVKRIGTLLLAAVLLMADAFPCAVSAYAETGESVSGAETAVASPSEAEEQKVFIETEDEAGTENAVKEAATASPSEVEILSTETSEGGPAFATPSSASLFATRSEAKRKKVYTKTVDGITVTVTADEGVFPDNAELYAEKIEKTEDEELDRKLEKAVSRKRRRDTRQSSSYVFDIRMYADGEEVQPDNDKGSVYVTFTMERALNEVETADIYHIVEEEANEEAELTAEKLEILSEEEVPADEVFAADGALFDESISLTAEIDGFSYYVVEFSYDDLIYEVWCSDDTAAYGGNTIYVYDILEKLGLNALLPTEASLSSTDHLRLENCHYVDYYEDFYYPFEEWYIVVEEKWDREDPVTLNVKTDTDEYSISIVCMDGPSGGAAARIGETEYASLHEAFAAAKSGETVVLLNDVSYAFGDTRPVIDLTESVTLDFNGKKLTVKDNLFTIEEGASLTLIDAQIEATGDDFIDINKGTLTIESTKGTGIVTSDDFVSESYGTVTVKSGSFNLGYSLVYENYGMIGIDSADMSAAYSLACYMYDGSALTIADGTFVTDDSADGGEESLVYEMSGTSTLDIAEGTFTSAYDIIMYVKDQSKITINGGTFTAGNAIIDSTESGTEVTINGGEMKSDYYAIDDISGKLKITGGTVISEEYGSVYINEGGEADISGGTFTCGSWGGLYLWKGTGVISGGAFYGNSEDGAALYVDESQVTISGGTFYGKNTSALYSYSPSTVILSGGEFIGGDGFAAVQPEENGSYDYVTVEEGYCVLPEDWKETKANRIEAVPDEKHIVFLTTKDKEPTEDSKWETWYEETIPKGSKKIANWPEDPEAPDALLYWYGWTDAEGKLYDAESSFERDTTLRATWLKRDVTTYTMSYRTGAGEEETEIIMPQDDEGKNGSAYTVADAPTQDGKPERDGYEFIDWTLTWREYYTVFYLDARNGKHLHEPKHVYGLKAGDSREETAIGIPGYELADEAVKTIEITEDGENRIIFYYDPVKVPYIVNYLEKETGKELSEPKTVTGRVFGETVTEEAQEIYGYQLSEGESAEKSLTLTDKGITENVINFYYERVRVSYTVNYLEKSTGQMLADQRIVPDRFFGDEVQETAVDLTGRYYVWDEYQKKLTLDTDGNEINFYYEKPEERYYVKYLERGTDKPLAPEKVVYGSHAGDTVTEQAIDIDGYVLAGDSEQTLTLVVSSIIKGEETIDIAKNEIVFYYDVYVPKKVSYTVRYVDIDTYELILPDKVVTDVVPETHVTEYAEAVKGYLPIEKKIDMYIVGDEVIVFFYYEAYAPIH